MNDHNPQFAALTATDYKCIEHIVHAKENILGNGKFTTIQRGNLNGQNVVVKRVLPANGEGRLFFVMNAQVV